MWYARSIVKIIQIFDDEYSSTIIQELAEYCNAKPSWALAYFYFDFKDSRKQGSRHLITAWIAQLLRQLNRCPDVLMKLHEKYHEGILQPTEDELLATLRVIIGLFENMYIAIDALDECSDQDALLAKLAEIAGWKIGTLHILTTSRKQRRIEDSLRQHATKLELDSKVVDSDIETHLRVRLREDPGLRRWTSEHGMIEASLMRDANGM